MTKKILIIGGSHAGSQAAVSLRQSGHTGPITIIGDELDHPYHRPPLSKDFLSGQKELDDILLRPKALYEDNNIEMKLGVRVTNIERATKTVSLSKGSALSYDKLILATGARVRKLPIKGADDPRCFYLRDSQDVRAIKSAVKSGDKAVIIGGGYIGLETAASLTKLGMKVTVLEAMDRILQRVTAPIMSDFYRRIHLEEGVAIAENEMADKIEVSDKKLCVKTKSGESFEAQMVIIGIGVIPNTELASEAGLETGNGIVVNEFCQTSDPDIYAIGDVSWHHNPIYKTDLRLESVPNATEQAKTAASHICGKDKPYSALPWFWSDQFDLKLQIAGLFNGYDDIITRGSTDEGRALAAFYFKGDQLLAVDAVNSPREFMLARSTLMKGFNLDKAILADPEADLKSAVIKP